MMMARIEDPLLAAGPTTSGPASRPHLTISLGQCSDKGLKLANQDFHGAVIPSGAALTLKGIAVATADGISTSSVGAVAAEAAVRSFLTDYYATSDAWPVKTAAHRVISATNSWLHAETRRGAHADDMDRGYVCSFTAMVLKARLAHIFHVGDCRISRLAGSALEPLTEDHRMRVSAQQTYLARALGAKPNVEIDHRAVPLRIGDVFVLASDGIHDHMSDSAVAAALEAEPHDLDGAARRIVREALAAGSRDNLSVQLVRIEALPQPNAADIFGEDLQLAPPPRLEPGSVLDHYQILRCLHSGSRSHVHLALDTRTGQTAAIKVPSTDLQGNADHLKRFVMEEWIARRLNDPHVLKAHADPDPRSHLYIVSEHVEGQTLAQWMLDHPRPDLSTVRSIAEQIARGLRAFHRLEMLHQDVRPQNVMIDRSGTVKLIDFGSARVAGVIEATPSWNEDDILGTVQYTAPEYFLDERGTDRSDLFSLAVIVYQMLTGRLPYGAEVAKTRSRAKQNRLLYLPTYSLNPDVPLWMDEALRKALQPHPGRRHEALSEFVVDLRRPNPALAVAGRQPLAERNPVIVWKGVSAVLALLVLLLLWRLSGAVGLYERPSASLSAKTQEDTLA